MRENRSFDAYLSEYQPAGQCIEAAGTDRTNFDPKSRKDVPRKHEMRYCVKDTNHEWSASHLEFDNGKNDGFVAVNNDSASNDGGARAMGFYNRDDIPFYYWLADNFAISDRYFASLLGPTHSNIMFYYKATSCGFAEGVDTNPNLTLECGEKAPTIFSLLDDKHVSYRVYSDYPLTEGAAAVVFGVYSPTKGVGSIADFLSDAAQDKLPSVVFVEPNYGKHFSVTLGTESDEHPPTNIQFGQAFSYHVISGLMSSPSWANSILFVTWDEHGGYYDHVIPPPACVPDESTAYDFAFDRYGFRVPFFVVSPFAKPGYVSHMVADHTSIVRFIEHWQDLPAMTNRDANAWPLLDMFQFDAPRTSPAPDPMLAHQSTDPVHVADCNGTGGTGMP
jgi:phospholipase C